MPKGYKEDLTGRRFKTYTAIEPVDRASGGSVIWRCVCDCGLEARHQIGNLKNGSVRCKCQLLPPGETAFRELYANYKRNARIRRSTKLDFEVSKEEFKTLVKGNCFYCGIEPKQIFKEKGSEFIYNGIDRVDNYKGYIPGNLVTCCGTCNRAKLQMTQEEFLSWVSKVYRHRNLT